ncbi:fusaric acid resistance domain protein [Klebsiella michiganensis]|uniref:Fusaric acid resistance domain protein n=1 Tax=Klebsiella michiganensis TaxID=1134687 RepID=A0A7H4LTT6_9ENTR|nr:fusaric acid resistance domain protein [Klebsiella michiganensis]
MLVAVLAPVYLLAGSLQARPPTTFMAMGITLTLPVLCELGARYSGDFADAANTAIALFFATGFAVIGMSLLQTVTGGRGDKASAETVPTRYSPQRERRI